QQPSLFGGAQQQGQQQPQLGQSTAQQPGSGLWSPGRAVTGGLCNQGLSNELGPHRTDLAIIKQYIEQYRCRCKSSRINGRARAFHPRLERTCTITSARMWRLSTNPGPRMMRQNGRKLCGEGPRQEMCQSL